MFWKIYRSPLPATRSVSYTHLVVYDTVDQKALVKTVLKELNIDSKEYPVNYLLSIISKEKEADFGPEEYIQREGENFRSKAIYNVYKACLLYTSLLDDRLIGIHLTNAQEYEVKKVTDHGARMVVCTTAIGVIDGIVPPAKQFQDFGGRVRCV